MKKKIVLIILIESFVIVVSFIIVLFLLSLLLYKNDFALALKDQRIIPFFIFVSFLNTLLMLYLLYKFSFFKRVKKVLKGQEQDLEFKSNLENSEFMTDDEMNSSFKNINYKELIKEDSIGVPIKAVEKDDEYNVTLSKITHSLIIGTTGSGKTTTFINPTIQILSSLKSKPSLVISDVKGELYETHVNLLKEKGYKIMVLDLRNPYESTKWNPLEESYDIYQKMLSLEKDVVNVGNTFYFNKKAYEKKEDALKVMNVEKRKLQDEVYENLNDITSAICPVDSKEDPTWEKGARNFILAIELAMLEDSSDDALKMTKERFNFYNLYQIATSNDDSCKKLMDYFNLRPSTSRAKSLSKQVLVGADKTRDSYLTTVYSKLSMFADLGICNLTSKNEIDLSNLEKEPTALFLEIPDEKETRHTLASLFITQAYKSLVKLSRKNEGLSLNRDVVFILDEFGNLPKIDKLSQMVTVGRSRRIYFFFVVQSYTQLDSVYGERVSQIVKSNCNVQVFIGTTDQKTVDEFSKRCGNMSILTRSISSSTKETNDFSLSTSLKERPIIYPSELQRLNSDKNMGNAIITIFGYKPIKSFFTPSFMLKTINLGGGEMVKEEKDVFDEKEVYYDISNKISLEKDKDTKEIETSISLKLEKTLNKKESLFNKKEEMLNLIKAFSKKHVLYGCGIEGIERMILRDEFDEALNKIKMILSEAIKSNYEVGREKYLYLESMLVSLSQRIKDYLIEEKSIKEEEFDKK